MKQIIGELGSLAAGVSEYNLVDPTVVRMVYVADGTAVTLIAGKDEFAKKVRRFLDHYQEIRRRAPAVLTLDLRLPDRITAVEEGPGAE
jgi:hypothetical protein